MFRDRLRAGDPVVGNWLSLGEPALAEVSADMGFDFVLIDTEHTPLSLETATDLARAVNAGRADETGTAPLLRVPWNDPVRIERALDVGVEGLMSPMVDTPAEARALVDAARYPPAGSRGLAAARAADYGRSFDEYVSRANDDLVLVAQMESGEAVANAADIAAVDGIDALFVGPADLSAAVAELGAYDDPAFVEAVATVLEAADDAGVPVGTLATDPEQIDRWAAVGFDFQIVGVDVSYVVEGARRAMERYADAMGDQ
jgi:2-dehydro-3-deoxyglucarate aldolase/4-hydroxy-2-oxoheptanedioate aldolase